MPLPPSVQLVNEPVPLVDRAIVPDGVRAGAGEVSVTVTVQLIELFTATEVELQVIAIPFVLKVEVIVPVVALVVECTVSPR